MTTPCLTHPEFLTASNGVTLLRRTESHYIALGSYDVKRWQYMWKCECESYKRRTTCAHLLAVLEVEGYSLCPRCNTFKEPLAPACLLCEARYGANPAFSIEEALDAQPLTEAASPAQHGGFEGAGMHMVERPLEQPAETPAAVTVAPNTVHIAGKAGRATHPVQPGMSVTFSICGHERQGVVIREHQQGHSWFVEDSFGREWCPLKQNVRVSSDCLNGGTSPESIVA